MSLILRPRLVEPDGTGIDYTYDTASRLLYIDNQTGSGQHKYGYAYDHVGNRMTMSVIDGSGELGSALKTSLSDIFRFRVTNISYSEAEVGGVRRDGDRLHLRCRQPRGIPGTP